MALWLSVGVLVMTAAAAGGWLVAHVVRVRETVRPELRVPILYNPLSVTNRVLLWLLRLTFRPSPISGAVRHTVAQVPRTSDRGAVSVHIYDPPGRVENCGAVVYIHGGGFISGSVESMHSPMSVVAADLGVLIVSVDYRLAPEHPFPAGFNDSYDALTWVHQNARDLRIDPSRIVVAGESAGAGIASGLCQRLRDEGPFTVALQLLTYPMLDDRTVSSDAQRRGLVGWSPAANRYAWRCYLGTNVGTNATPQYAAPARRVDLSGLPPAWIGVGSLDLFYTEDVDYAQRLSQAGVPCTLFVGDGLYHGADSLIDAADAPAVYDFAISRLAALREALGLPLGDA